MDVCLKECQLKRCFEERSWNSLAFYISDSEVKKKDNEDMVPNTLYGLTFLESLLIALSWPLEYWLPFVERMGAQRVWI